MTKSLKDIMSDAVLDFFFRSWLGVISTGEYDHIFLSGMIKKN
jgi:hypothetical protein